MTNKPVSERELMLGILLEVTEHGGYSHLVLRDVLAKYQYLDKKERAFITRVSEGTLEHMMELDYILDQFSKVKVKKMKPVIRNLLRSAVYQLKYMDSVPDAAVCNESVKLAVKKGFGSLRGFVNGVLRNVARNLDNVSYPEDSVDNLSIRYSMPRWILELWIPAYGMENVERMLQSFQEEQPLVIRCRDEKVPEHLRAEGVHAEPHPYLPYAWQISGFDYLGGLESFRSGEFSVQDISSMLVGETADPQTNDYVIDVCAAPGGKSIHVAEKLGGSGHVEARDLTPYKVGMIEENIERTGLLNIEAVCQDALVYDEGSREKADIVIADLPCSGLGVLGKKTDLKYKATKQGAAELAQMQREMLDVVCRYVKSGGKLLYSTCTVNPAENEENVRWFLETHPEFELADLRECMKQWKPEACEELLQAVSEEGWLQLLPGIHKSDGFFIAGLRKRK